MKACGWEERIARLVDGESDTDALEHAAGCVECRELLTDLRDQQTMLRSEPRISEFALAAVRARVMAEVAQPRRGWRWVWASVPALACVVAFAMLWQPPAVEPLPMIAVAPPAPVLLQKAAVPPPVRKPRRNDALPPEMEKRLAELMRPKRVVAETQNVVYMAKTKDPDVVIMLVRPYEGEPNE